MVNNDKELDWFFSKNFSNKGQKVGYRRVSGKIGLTSRENGARGAWVEKRISLFKKLIEFGHRIIPLSEATEATKESNIITFDGYQKCDVLMLEFGGNNLQFYKKYWDKTIEIIKLHKGKIIFLNDDPDLPFLWKLLPDENWSRWIISANAKNTEAVKNALKCPSGCRVVDFPMASGMPFEEFQHGELSYLIYIGRPNGRSKYFKEFTKSKHLKVAGKPEEWKEYVGLSIIENPQQRERRKFYQMFYGCLSVYDDKHKDTGWRTGRAYHSLCAGIPACAPVGNSGLEWCYPIETSEDIDKFILLGKEERKKIWEKQKSVVEKESYIDPLLL